MQEAEPYFDSEDLFEHYKKKDDFYETKEKAHGKIEHRQYYLVRPSKRSTRKIFGWNLEFYLMSLLVCFDTDTLVEAMLSVKA